MGKAKMDGLTKTLVLFVVIVHIMFFVLEAILWMVPIVHEPLLVFLDNPVSLEFSVQALALKNLFVNQGFYNLFLVVAGVTGLLLLKKNSTKVGYALILFLCFAATGAGIVLALSTKAYILAFFQAVPAAVAFKRLLPLYKNA